MVNVRVGSASSLMFRSLLTIPSAGGLRCVLQRCSTVVGFCQFKGRRRNLRQNELDDGETREASGGRYQSSGRASGEYSFSKVPEKPDRARNTPKAGRQRYGPRPHDKDKRVADAMEFAARQLAIVERKRSADQVQEPTSDGGREGNNLMDVNELENQEANSSVKQNNIVGDALYGVAPVLNALKFARRETYTLYQLETINLDKRKDARAVLQIMDIVRSRKIPTKRVPRHDLNMLADNRPHQGFILDCSPIQWTPKDYFIPASEVQLNEAYPVWLALDEVVDPQNFGAILRSAHCLGAAGVLACRKNCAPLSPVVSKASAGALESMTLYNCVDMPGVLSQAAANGWMVLGAAASKDAITCRNVKIMQPTILVMGSEGAGLRTNVRRSCTSLVQVDMALSSSPETKDVAVESLNVSVAAGILLYSVLGAAKIQS